MKLECYKCGKIEHYDGYFHPDLRHFICSACQDIDEMAEEASYRGEEEDEEDE
jgi:hypothetical protein